MKKEVLIDDQADYLLQRDYHANRFTLRLYNPLITADEIDMLKKLTDFITETNKELNEQQSKN